MKLNTSLTMALAVSAVTTLGALAQVTVYEVTGPGANNFYSSLTEFGDEAVLPTATGGSWVISSITLPYYSNYDFVGGMSLNLYKNDGALGSPGTLLYQSGPLDISKGSGNGSTLSLTFPNIAGNEIPDRLTYSVNFQGQGGGNIAGLIVPNLAPTIGSSGNDFWQRGASGWTLNQVQGGDLSNFQVSITAVPEPGPIALAGAGAAAWLGLMAFRRFQGR